MPKSLPPLDEVLKFGARAVTPPSTQSATPQISSETQAASTESSGTSPDKCPLTTDDAATSTSTQDNGEQPSGSATRPDPADAEELYLIAHVVRGQIAFDVAHKLQIGNEEGWITSTYGHRAYPLWSKSLSDLGIDLLPDGNWAWGRFPNETYSGLIGSVPPGWRDHFQAVEISKGRQPRPARGVQLNIDLGDIEI